MASACVNNITMSPERFSPAAAGKYSSYGWLSPRISFSRDDDSSSSSSSKKQQPPPPTAVQDQVQDLPDFEFRLDDPVGMLPADELFSDGKLVPTQLTSLKPFPPETATETTSSSPASGRRMEVSGNSTSTITDQYLFSPKAPRCSSRWKELLGLRKFYHNTPSKPAGGGEGHKTTPLLSSSSSSSQQQKSLMRHFLHRNSKSCSSCHSSLDSSLSLPLLKDLDCESVSISSSRLSLSSSSSSHEHEDLPRLSLDSEKQQPNNNPNLNFNPLQSPNPFVLNRNPTGNNNINPPRMRMVKHRGGEVNSADGGAAARVGRSPMKRSSAAESSGVTSRGASVDSPRLNSSGKLIFESLERSSSSPSSFNGGPRHKHKGMERSYSANVRVTPVLNVPVCSLRGSSKSGSVFGFFSSSSPQKRDGGGGIHRQQSSGSGSNSRGARSDRDGSSKQVTSSTTTPTIKF
ncbi:hypothetical protein LINGRAHAP2_LOCUS21741 [Linum grandiflorum]